MNTTGTAMLLAGAAGGLLAWVLLRPLPPLARRVRPYTSGNRTRLDLPADPSAPTGAGPSGAAGAVLGPLLAAAALTLSRLIDREPEPRLALRLRQAGYAPDLAETDRLERYRLQRVTTAAGAAGAGGLLGLILADVALMGLLGCCGLVWGVTAPRSRVATAIARRRERISVDLQPINHQLAISQLTGGGVDDALRRLVQRGSGPVVEELAEALRWRRAGLALPEALRRLAERTVEPHAARTYLALAAAADQGAPIADALLDLSEDVRNSRRDAMERRAVRRRATMTLPLLAFLVPPLLLLIGAPLGDLLSADWNP